MICEYCGKSNPHDSDDYGCDQEKPAKIETVRICLNCKKRVQIMGSVTQWYANLDGSEHICTKGGDNERG